MTKQSMGDLIQKLEAQGYVERTRDEKDKRASIVKFTESGSQFLQDAYEIKQEIEAEYATLIGDEVFTQLKSALIQILNHSAKDVIR